VASRSRRDSSEWSPSITATEACETSAFTPSAIKLTAAVKAKTINAISVTSFRRLRNSLPLSRATLRSHRVMIGR
jgi:hypothetical protein